MSAGPQSDDGTARLLGDQGHSDLPAAIVEALAAADRLHERHQREASLVQRVLAGAPSQLARPGTVLVLLAFVAVWVAINFLTGVPRFDPPPFAGLQTILGAISLCLACMILTTQRRDDQLASHRAHLTLQIVLIAEQKSAKAIALLEELRRDLPMLRNRPDDHAAQLAEPTDTEKVIERLGEQSIAPAPGE